MTGERLPRGIRNNNPFNIKRSNHEWLGKIHSSDRTFEQFANMVFGIRAGLKLLCTYVNNYGLTSIEGIIRRFAPSTENNTACYINHICFKTGINRGKILSSDEFFEVASAVAVYENGLNYNQTICFGLDPIGLKKIFTQFNLKLTL